MAQQQFATTSKSQEKTAARRKSGKRSKSKESKGKPKNPLKQKRFRHNWRTDMLAVPRGHQDLLDAFKLAKKDEEEESKASVKVAPSGISLRTKRSKKLIPIEEDRTRLKRLEQMTLAPIRVYQVQKKMYAKQCGKKFEARMNHKVKLAHHSIYHEYDVARVAMKKKKRLQRLLRQASGKSKGKGAAKKEKKEKGKGKKGKGKGAEAEGPKVKKPPLPNYRMQARLRKKRPHAERLKEALEWCKTACLPKKPPKPPKVERGKIIDVESIQENLIKLAKPTHFYKRPSQDSMNIINRNKIKPAALRYRITDNVAKLARPMVKIVFEPRALGEVVPEALTAKTTPRTLELAVPKPKPATNDNDYNEDAFKISPTALKYVATPRILELAKPKEVE